MGNLPNHPEGKATTAINTWIAAVSAAASVAAVVVAVIQLLVR